MEANRQAGITPPAKTVGHEAREIKKLLVEGFAEDLVAAAIALQVSKGLSPAVLASVMVDAQRERSTVRSTQGGAFRAYDAA